MKRSTRKKVKHSRYCEHSYMCNKDINCIDGNFCESFEHTDSFSSMEKEVDISMPKDEGFIDEHSELNFD